VIYFGEARLNPPSERVCVSCTATHSDLVNTESVTTVDGEFHTIVISAMPIPTELTIPWIMLTSKRLSVRS